MKNMMKEIKTIQEFEEAYTQDGITIFVFSADWCPDCLFIKGFMPRLIEKYNHYHFRYMDRDQFPEVCERLQIMGIPSFVAIKDGKEVNRFVSKLRKSEAEIDAFFASL